MKKSTALGTSRSGGARNPHVFHPIHSGSCAPAERDFPSLATIFSQALSFPIRRQSRARFRPGLLPSAGVRYIDCVGRSHR
ncbi:MAG: hypothetical protein ACREYE_04095 [Gammaproteobacteria bacterium]